MWFKHGEQIPMVYCSAWLHSCLITSPLVLGGTHSGYPAFEVWAYQDGKAPDLLYVYNPSRKDAGGAMFNISFVTVDVQSGLPSINPIVP